MMYSQDSPIEAQHRRKLFPAVAERELYPLVEELIRKRISPDGNMVFQEFNGPIGVPDFLHASHLGEAFKDRLQLPAKPVLSLASCRILALLPANKGISIAALTQRLDSQPAAVQSRLAALESLGLAHKNEKTQLITRDPAMAPIGRLTAVEAKIGDWNRAIRQSFRYSRWADSAFVVLGNPPKNIDQATMLARSLGLGLHASGRWVVRPRNGRPDPGMKLLASEMVIAQIKAMDLQTDGISSPRAS